MAAITNALPEPAVLPLASDPQENIKSSGKYNNHINVKYKTNYEPLSQLSAKQFRYGQNKLSHFYSICSKLSFPEEKYPIREKAISELKKFERTERPKSYAKFINKPIFSKDNGRGKMNFIIGWDQNNLLDLNKESIKSQINKQICSLNEKSGQMWSVNEDLADCMLNEIKASYPDIVEFKSPLIVSAPDEETNSYYTERTISITIKSEGNVPILDLTKDQIKAQLEDQIKAKYITEIDNVDLAPAVDSLFISIRKKTAKALKDERNQLKDKPVTPPLMSEKQSSSAIANALLAPQVLPPLSGPKEKKNTKKYDGGMGKITYIPAEGKKITELYSAVRRELTKSERNNIYRQEFPNYLLMTDKASKTFDGVNVTLSTRKFLIFTENKRIRLGIEIKWNGSNLLGLNKKSIRGQLDDAVLKVKAGLHAENRKGWRGLLNPFVSVNLSINNKEATVTRMLDSIQAKYENIVSLNARINIPVDSTDSQLGSNTVPVSFTITSERNESLLKLTIDQIKDQALHQLANSEITDIPDELATKVAKRLFIHIRAKTVAESFRLVKEERSKQPVMAE